MKQFTGRAPIIMSGRAIGNGSVCGLARFVRSPAELAALRPGEILLVEDVTPDWDDRIGAAACIIANRGETAGHAGVVARRLGVPVVVGSVDGAAPTWTGARLAVTCVEGVGWVRELGIAPED